MTATDSTPSAADAGTEGPLPDAATTTHQRGRGWALAAFSACIVQAVAVVVQPIAIGGYLNGNPSGMSVHRTNADIIGLIALIVLVLVIVAALRSRWGAQPIVLVTVFTVAMIVQEFMGFEKQLAVHIPLGVAVVAFAVALPITIGKLLRRTGSAR